MAEDKAELRDLKERFLKGQLVYSTLQFAGTVQCLVYVGLLVLVP